MALPDLTLQELADMNGGELPYKIRWQFARSHEDRFELVEQLLDECYRRLVDGRQHNQQHGEDALTQSVVDMMSVAGVPAEHDPQIGGHVDIVVRGANGFLFVLEAKKHTQYKWLVEGFLQLSTRYAVAQPGRDRGEVLIYCRRRRGDRVLDVWQQRLFSVVEGLELVEADGGLGGLFFRTRHVCQSSGSPFTVRHKLVPLYFNPAK